MAAPMSRKKQRGSKKRKIENDSDSEQLGVDNSDDSDAELQQAFTRGELKPGLNVQVTEKTFINNVPAMRTALTDLHLDLPWVERLDLTNIPAPASTLLKAETAHEIDVNDDFKRELTFYRQAQSTVLQALPDLVKNKIPTRRPEDYFAQMAKTDLHMKKVRERLMSKKVSMERSEKAKKLRDLRKYGKKVQQEVLQNRHKQKREMLDAVKKFRQGQKDKLDFLEDDKKSEVSKKKQTEADKKPKANKRREYKNKKFGHGGQKKRSKYNTKESAADVTGFSGRVNSNMKKKNFKSSATGKKAGAAKRPGKARRQGMKNKSR